MTDVCIHPCRNDKGQPVVITHPSQPTGPENWALPDKRATVTPGGAMPHEICGIPIESWRDHPTNNAGWEALAAVACFEEPPFAGQAGKKPASGAVVLEPDGRVWVVSPSNKFGGYTHTFPKGKFEDATLSFKANALKEVFEESGLQVELVDFLCDAKRDTSTTRFYLARRLGGNPADMGWESQAVHLVPRDQLACFVSHPNDKGVIAALAKFD